MSSPGFRLNYHDLPAVSDDNASDSPRLMPLRDSKDSPKLEERGVSCSGMIAREDSFKFSIYESGRREQMTDFGKTKLSSLSSEDETTKWDFHLKQEPSRSDGGFSGSLNKKSNFHRLSLRELEPGEVPSDSDDDSDTKCHSPKPSTLLENSKLSLFLRDREDRLPSSLERHKFYSFALDKTITPDTKALLERAKSLSSSREENWSFLDWDSRFASFRNNKDKEKVESAPRPIPSWYMKKKKIRTDSEGKIDDKKDDQKEEEQEKQELFASRFLHSSIFEQDSKRLQHLEKKDDDLDFLSGRLYGRQLSSDGLNSTAELVQEPVVLFHSRFIELTRMQQKEKEKDQKPKEPEKQELAREIHPKTPERVSDVKEPEVSTVTITGPSLPSVLQTEPQEPLPLPAEKALDDSQTAEVTEVKVEAPVESPCAVEQSKPKSESPSTFSTVPVDSVELVTDKEQKNDSASVPVVEVELAPVEHTSYFDTKPPTPGASFSHEDISMDTESAELNIVSSPGTTKNTEEADEPKEESTLSVLTSSPNTDQKAEETTEKQALISDNDMEAELPVTPKDRKLSRNKRTKATLQTSVTNIVEKPATRKSERIDREKRKRSSSPRVEVPKIVESKAETDKVSKTPAKSPNNVVELESPEPNVTSRTRRKVKSVYATIRDDDPLPAKGSTESLRSTRKRAEKDVQEVASVTTPPRRGRPPKSRRKPGEDVSPTKVNHVKQETEEIDAKEIIESPKPIEGWRSPRSHKLLQRHSSPSCATSQGRRGKNESKATDISLAPPDNPPEEANQETTATEDTSQVTKDNAEAKDEESHNSKEVDSNKNSECVSAEVAEKKSASEKVTKVKSGRSRNMKTANENKPVCLKSLEIRLSVDEVKEALQQEEPEPADPPLTEDKSLKNDSLHTAPKDATEGPCSEVTSSDSVTDPAHSSEDTQLAKQIELEQAVENIAKLTEASTLSAYKEHRDESEIGQNDEGDKPAHQASETELAAAIGSIITDEISVEADNFPAPQPYSGQSEPEVAGDTLSLPPVSQESMEPETNQPVTNIFGTDAPANASDHSVTAPAPSVLEPEGKNSEDVLKETSVTVPEAEPVRVPLEVTRKKGRSKTPRSKRRRGSSNKKSETTAECNINENDAVQAKDLKPTEATNAVETISEEPANDEDKNKDEKTHKMVVESKPNSDFNTIAEISPSETNHNSKSSSEICSSRDLQLSTATEDKSQTLLQLHHTVESNPVTPPSVPKLTLPLMSTSGVPPVSAGTASQQSNTTIVPEWKTRHEDARPHSTPPPAHPPDTKASDIDSNSSTLRRMLLESKYVSAKSVPTTQVTAAVSEPVSSSCLEETSNPTVEEIKPALEEKTVVPAGGASVPPPTEVPAFNEKQKFSSTVITPKATSVISRMSPGFDLDETPRITLGKPSSQPMTSSMSSAKHKPRVNINDNRYHAGSMAVIDETRPAEMSPLTTGSSPGLRVNTSEGVVVLSYSGQKTEGPQRISAKISQIPPASAVDIEFQQSVSKSQIKQESVTQVTPKSSQATTNYVSIAPHTLPTHTASQTYNTQPVISSVKQEHATVEKVDPTHLSSVAPPSQAGTVKILSPSSPAVSSAPVVVYGQLVHQQNVTSASKKVIDAVALKSEPAKHQPPSTLSPGLSPHHPSLTGKLQSDVNHVTSGPSTPTDRTLPHLGVVKQEPHSPRNCGHSPSPYPKVCQPNNASSPAHSVNNTSVMLATGIPVPQYVSSMHPEQSVIMPPHSVAQPVSLGHLTQGEVRMNSPYGVHSPRGALQPQIEIRPQRSNTPQPTPVRDMVMPPLHSQHPQDDEMTHYHQVTRPSGPLHPDVLVMQPDFRMPSGPRLEQYNIHQEMLLSRDVRIMMHSHMTGVGEHTDTRQTRTPDGTVKSASASKTPQPSKETSKPSEVKMAHSPHSESRLVNVNSGNQLSGLSLAQPVVVPHPVQLMHPNNAPYHDFRSMYDMRNYHPSPPQLTHQFPGTSSMGMNLQSRSITPSQPLPDGEHVHSSQPIRSKTPQISQDSKRPPSTGSDHSHHISVNRHPGQLDTHVHVQRVQVETSQSYSSPAPVSVKQELPAHLPSSAQKQIPFITTPVTTTVIGVPSGISVPRTESQPVVKQEPPASQRPVDMVQLLTKYPIVWQGLLALKNDTAAVQLHFVSGNNVLAHRSLPAPEGGPPLRIAQRMRLEASQLEGVARRMMVESDYCLLLALPCGRDQEDVVNQTESLKAAFISYLQAKQAAGIINVPNPGSNQPAYVLQIFPPCEFSENHLSRLAPDLLSSISNISPHLMIVIASV